MANQSRWLHLLPQKVDHSGRIVSYLELKIVCLPFCTWRWELRIHPCQHTDRHKQWELLFVLPCQDTRIDRNRGGVHLHDARFQTVVKKLSAQGLPHCCIWTGVPSSNTLSTKERRITLPLKTAKSELQKNSTVSFIRSPKLRNDTLFVKPDNPLKMQLLECNDWLQPKAWKTIGCNA